MNNRINAAVTGAVAGLAGVAQAAAQTRLQDKFFGGGDEGETDIASAGNGGVATSSASGGAVSIGDINSGGNVCNAIGIGDSYMDPVVYGGDCLNTTAIGVAVDGGTAISDASGGDYNLAFVS
ncbi:MAG TPA: hypothetical protein VK356_08185 [Thermomicrobiales bacterium]|jgi:hypothetical protein|nr:hypothetical protein [Thermomicrobiales bacterium]